MPLDYVEGLQRMKTISQGREGMPIRKTLLGFLLVVGVLCNGRSAVGQSLNATPPEVLTLDQAVSLALMSNRQLKNSTLEVAKAREQIFAGHSLWLPTFDLKAEGLQQLKPITFVVAQGVLGVNPFIGPIPATDAKIVSPARPTGIIDFRASQPLSELYRIKLQATSLRLNRDFAQEELRAKQHEIIQKVKQVYLAILQAESGLQSSTQDVKRYHELERETDEYLAQGLALKGDSLEVQLRLARAEDQMLSLNDQLAAQKQQLNQLLGRDVLTDFLVSQVQEQTGDDVVLTAGRAGALDRRPELKEAQLRIEQAEQDRRIKKSEFIPQARIMAQYLGTQNFNEIVPRNALAVGMSLDWEVFDWGRRRHELDEKDFAIQQLNNNLQETKSSILVEVDAKFRSLQQARQRLRIADLARQVADEKVRVVAARYQVQASLLNDVLQEQAALEEANHQYQVAITTLWLARAEFENATGEDK
jgi:outer membrane protein TolC